MFNFFALKKITVLKIFFLSLVKALIFWLRTWLLILFLGKKVGILSSLVVLGFYYFVLMIPIPASLGSYEIFQIFAFNNLNLEAGTAIAFVLIVRTVEIILAFLGLFVAGYLSVKLLKNILEEKIKKIREILKINPNEI